MENMDTMRLEVKISIIIPMYNVEKYLEQCIESAEKQSVKEKEIICIDDGSTDKTLEMIKRLMEKYNNISLIQQKHQGSGIARNKGIESANGKFVIFLDADDYYLEENALERMISACEKQSIPICGSYRKNLIDGEIQEEQELNQLFLGKAKKLEEEGRKISYREFQYDYFYHSFIFERKFLRDNNLSFPDYIRYQDPPFLVAALDCAGDFLALPVYLYCYRIGHQNRKQIDKKIPYTLKGMRDTLNVAVEQDYWILYNRILKRIKDEIVEAVVDNFSDEILSLLEEIATLLSKPKCYENIQSEECRNIVGRLWAIVYFQLHEKEIHSYLNRNEMNKIGIYGVGKHGKILLRLFKKNESLTLVGIDRKVTSFENIKVLNPEEDTSEYDMVIVSPLKSEEIIKEYSGKKYKNMMTIEELVDMYNKKENQMV